MPTFMYSLLWKRDISTAQLLCTQPTLCHGSICSISYGLHTARLSETRHISEKRLLHENCPEMLFLDIHHSVGNCLIFSTTTHQSTMELMWKETPTLWPRIQPTWTVNQVDYCVTCVQQSLREHVWNSSWMDRTVYHNHCINDQVGLYVRSWTTLWASYMNMLAHECIDQIILPHWRMILLNCNGEWISLWKMMQFYCYMFCKVKWLNS